MSALGTVPAWRRRLAAAGSELVPDAALLGVDLFGALAGEVPALHDVLVDLTDDTAAVVRGRVALFGATGVEVELRLFEPADVASPPDIELRLQLGADDGWGPEQFRLSGVTLQARTAGAGADRHVEGSLTGLFDGAPLEATFSVAPGAGAPWGLAVRLEGEQLHVLEALAGEALAMVVGPTAPLPGLGALAGAEVVLELEHHSFRMRTLAATLRASRVACTADLAVEDATLTIRIEDPPGPAGRSATAGLRGALVVGGVAVPVSLALGQEWVLSLGGPGGPGGDGVSLPELLAAVGGPTVSSAWPEAAGSPGAVRVHELRAVLRRRSPAAAPVLSELHLALGADLDLSPGLRLHDGALGVTLRELAGPARQVVLAAAGTVELAGLRFDVTADRTSGAGGGWQLHGALRPDGATLTDVLAAATGGPVDLPPELPDITVEALTVDWATDTGARTFDGVAEAGWALPLGGLQAATLALHVERAAATAPSSLALRVGGSGAVAAVDGVTIDSFELAFTREGAAWAVAGTLAAELLGHPVQLEASLAADALVRTVRLAQRSDPAAGPLTVVLGEAGQLDLRAVALELTTAKPGTGPSGVARPAAEASAAGGGEGPRRVGAGWRLRAEGRLDLLDSAIALDGALGLSSSAGGVGIAFEPSGVGGAEVAFVLPGTQGVGVHLGLERFELQRSTGSGAAAWTARAAPSIWFSGLPGALTDVLPAGATTALRAELDLAADAVAVRVRPVLARCAVPLGALDLLGRSIPLGTAAAAVDELGVRWERGGALAVEAAFAVGLPPQLNTALFGGAAVLSTFDEATGTGMVGCRLLAGTGGGTGSLGVRLLDSPFAALRFDRVPADAPATAPRTATLDLGACGQLVLEVPELRIEGGAVRMRGGFRQRGLALPTGPLAHVLRGMDLDGLAKALPATLPLRDLTLLAALRADDVDRVLETVLDLPEAVVASVPKGTLESALRDLLGGVADRVDRLPERLLPFLDSRVPERFSFDLAVSPAGAVRGRIAVGDGRGRRGGDTPLRLLFPGLNVTGPVLNGIELWSLSVGEVLGGAVLTAEVDADLEQFDLLPLLTVLAAPAELAAVLPDTTRLRRTLVLDRVTTVIVPEVPLALPVLFEDLAVHHVGLEGIEAAAHLRVPHPSLSVAGVLPLFHQLESFFTTADGRLDATALQRAGLDLRLEAGPAYLQLPPELGGHLLGDRRATTSVSGAEAIAGVLNGLKGLRLDQLVAALPDALRRGRVDATTAVGATALSVGGAWALGGSAGGSAGGEAVGSGRGVALHLAGEAAVGPLPLGRAALDVRTAGSGAVGVAVSVDAGDASFVGLHLDASLDTGALAVGGHRPTAALWLTAPEARLRTPGNDWTPAAFTVEWWWHPTVLRDDNQFVSADDRWGAFTLHATATGAAYCGTDVATRLTPAELPPGTITPGRWQHIAVSYERGTLTVHRDGVVVARRAGVTRPRPWTGMRCGMPEVGTECSGGFAELRVWDVARSTADIAAWRTRRLSGREPGLVGYWPCDEGAGTVVRDRAGVAHGELTAGGWSTASTPAVGAATTSPAARLQGRSRVSLFGRNVLTGEARIQSDGADLFGRLDLFGDNPALVVRGDLAGTLTADHFTLDGGAVVRLAGFEVVDARLHATERGIEVHGRWLEHFDAALSLSRDTGRPAFSGRLTGRLPLSVVVGAQYLPRPSLGPIKLCDRFTVHTELEVDLGLFVEPSGAFVCQGTAAYVAGAQRFTGQLALRGAPADLTSFAHLLEGQVLANARATFNALYHSAERWLAGTADGTVGWVRSNWNATGDVLLSWFGRTGAQAVGLLNANGYAGAEIGLVLRDAFRSDPTGLGRACRAAGLEVTKAAHAVFEAFEKPLGRTDAFVQANSVCALLRDSYGALDVAPALRERFGIDAAATLQALHNQRYGANELATVARTVCNLTLEETARQFNKLGVEASVALGSLQNAYATAGARAVAASLAAAGYPRKALNTVLSTLDLPAV